VFHACDATSSIEAVIEVAIQRSMTTDETLDALLRMGRVRHASPHAKASYAYRLDSLTRCAGPLQRSAKPAS
jgi:hypothetical protein